MRLVPALAGLGLLAMAGPAFAKEPQRHPLIDTALRCRAIADVTARVRCYDEAMAGIEASLSSGELVAKVRDEDDEQELPEEFETTVISAGRAGYANWVVALEGGGSWRTTENSEGQPLPKSGDKALLRRTRFGGHFLSIKGRLGLRAIRVR